MQIGIEFFSPQGFGLDMKRFKDPYISRAYCANVFLIPLDNLPFTVFFHAGRKVEGGIEYRSRYWIGYTMKPDGPLRVDRPFSLMEIARSNCLHSLTEYNNLASFLPQLHNEMEGKIDRP